MTKGKIFTSHNTGEWVPLNEIKRTYGYTSEFLKNNHKLDRQIIGNTSMYMEPASTPKAAKVAKPLATSAAAPTPIKTKIKEKGGVKQFLDALKSENGGAKVISQPLKLLPNQIHRKILSLSDVHCPFHDKELIHSIIREHSDADVCVLNGDIIDAYAASSFSKDKLVSLHEEYCAALDLVAEAAETFPSVIIVRGNHDQRVDRIFGRSFDSANLMLARKDILAELAAGVVFDEDGNSVGTLGFENVLYNKDNNPWIARVGKTVFMHPHTYGSSPMATVYKCLHHLKQFVPWDSFDSVVIGHTHKSGKVVEEGKLLIEQGCLTKIMDYQKVGVLVNRPVSLGYALIYQDESGATDFNLSTNVYLGTLNYMD